MNIIAITFRLLLFTFIFIILMFVFNWGENIENIFENISYVNRIPAKLWNVFIPVFIADTSIFIWLFIEWIRFNPKENVTKDD